MFVIRERLYAHPVFYELEIWWKFSFEGVRNVWNE